MLQNESSVKIIDNTGAKEWKIVRILKWSNPRFATVWDRVVVAIKKATPGWMVSKGDVVWAVIVRTTKEIKRDDGSYIRFEDNAAVVINKELKPRGKRVFWPVVQELRHKWHKDIASLAEEVI